MSVEIAKTKRPALKMFKLGNYFPTIIITAFFGIVLVTAYLRGLPMPVVFSDILRRFGMHGLLVLAMVPSIQSGTGPNFALPVGIVCGLLAMVLGVEFGYEGFEFIIFSAWTAIVLATGAGFLYGKLLNAVKGSEMTIATYTGFSIVAFMSLVWLAGPFNSKKMGWMMGSGLRETVQLDAVKADAIINNFLAFTVKGVRVPTGLLLVFFAFCLLVWLFTKTKTGIAIEAGGINPQFAAASGLNINKNRVIANVLSTILGALGIILYAQSFGYFQLYLGPLMMAFGAVAGVLIGGATASRATVFNAIIGVFLFQGLLTTAMPVANQLFGGTDLSEIMRVIVQYAIILYALAQVGGMKK